MYNYDFCNIKLLIIILVLKCVLRIKKEDFNIHTHFRQFFHNNNSHVRNLQGGGGAQPNLTKTHYEGVGVENS